MGAYTLSYKEDAGITAQQIGRWTLVRSIFDADAACAISCTGFAELRPHDDAIAYDEGVWYRLAGKRIHATRAYRFCSSEGAIVATFEDGSPFFTLQLNADGSGTAIHPCGDDLYTLTLSLGRPNSWQTQWDVSGTKRLRIVTRYTR